MPMIESFNEEVVERQQIVANLSWVTIPGRYDVIISSRGKQIQCRADIEMRFDRDVCRNEPKVIRFWHVKSEDFRVLKNPTVKIRKHTQDFSRIK